MIDSVYFSNEELENIVMKEILGQEDEEKNTRRLAYTIHKRYCEVNDYNWRETLDQLKWVRNKLAEGQQGARL